MIILNESRITKEAASITAILMPSHLIFAPSNSLRCSVITKRPARKKQHLLVATMSIAMPNVEKSFSMVERPLTWFITGCSSGLGTEIARRALEKGHTVIATSRDPSRTPELVQEVESKGGKWLQLDVDDLNSGKVIENLEASGTKIDVLVNNAGYAIHHVVEQFSEEEVREQMDTLYFGPFRLIRATLPYMRQRRFGVILNISSGAALEGRESMGAYAGAKAALDGEHDDHVLHTLNTKLTYFRHDKGSRQRSRRIQRTGHLCVTWHIQYPDGHPDFDGQGAPRRRLQGFSCR